MFAEQINFDKTNPFSEHFFIDMQNPYSDIVKTLLFVLLSFRSYLMKLLLFLGTNLPVKLLILTIYLRIFKKLFKLIPVILQ